MPSGPIPNWSFTFEYGNVFALLRSSFYFFPDVLKRKHGYDGAALQKPTCVFVARFAIRPKRFVLRVQEMFPNCVRNSLWRQSFVAIFAPEFDNVTGVNFRVIAS